MRRNIGDVAARRSSGADSPSVVLVWGAATGMGGTETRMCEVIRELARQDVPCMSHMLSSRADSELGRALGEAGSQVVASRSTVALSRSIAGARPTLVVSLGLRASLLTRLLRVMLLILGRGGWSLVDARNGLEAGRSRALWVADRATQCLVSTYLANSLAVRDLLRVQGIAERRIHVLFSALPSKWNVPARGSRRPGSVVMIGNDRPEKQQDWGVRAFADARVRGDLTIYTDRGDRVRDAWAEVAPQAVGSFSCVEGVRITPELLDEYAVMLHPSSHESASRAVIEARARGCFVVGFDVGDARRLVGVEGGKLVAAGDLDALTAALRNAVDASLRGTLPQNPVPVRDPSTYTKELLELARPSRAVAPRCRAGERYGRKSR